MYINAFVNVKNDMTNNPKYWTTHFAKWRVIRRTLLKHIFSGECLQLETLKLFLNNETVILLFYEIWLASPLFTFKWEKWTTINYFKLSIYLRIYIKITANFNLFIHFQKLFKIFFYKMYKCNFSTLINT